MKTIHKSLALGLVSTMVLGIIGCRFEKKESVRPLEQPAPEQVIVPAPAMPTVPPPPEVNAPATPETMVQPAPAPAAPSPSTSGTTPEQESGY